MNQKEMYKNVIVYSFFIPCLIAILSAVPAFYLMSYLFNFFAFENPYNNYENRWFMIISMIAIHIYNFSGMAYKRLCSYDSTFTFSTKQWFIIYAAGAVIYITLLYMVFRTLHTPLKSFMWATGLYGMLVAGTLFGKLIERRRNNRKALRS